MGTGGASLVRMGRVGYGAGRQLACARQHKKKCCYCPPNGLEWGEQSARPTAASILQELQQHPYSERNFKEIGGLFLIKLMA